jgi:hypothetical protein
MAQQTLDDGVDLGPSPEDVATSQENTYNQELQRGGSVQRNMANITRGAQLASGGGPQMVKAQNVQSRLQAILSNVNQDADPNEDPLTKQMRIAKALSVGMIDVAPQIALQANQQAQRINQAQQQQKLLSLQMQAAQTNLDQSQFKDKVQQITGQIVFAKKGEDGGMEAYDTVNPSDPEYQTKVAQIQAKAQQDGVQVMPMTADSFINGKNALSVLQAQRTAQQNDTKLKIAEMQSNERWQAAMLAAQTKGQQLSGNQAMMSQRIMSAADLGSQTLQNIMETPLGASAGGAFGIGSAPGKSVIQTTVDDLRNRVAPQEAQSLNVMFTGLARNLGTIEAQGGLQGAQAFSEQIKNGIQIRDGDTTLTALTRMAEASQIIHKGTEVYLANPKLDPQVKQVVQDAVAKLDKAIPFTVHDLTMFQRSQKANPGLTFGQFAQMHGLGNDAKPDGAAQDGLTTMVTGDGKTFAVAPEHMAAFKQKFPDAHPGNVNPTAPGAPDAK